MNKEMLIHNLTTNGYEIQQTIYEISKYSFDTISIPLFLLPTYKEYCSNLKIAVPIAFPYGTSLRELKCHEMIRACHNGASILDLTLNPYHINNGNQKELKRELEAASTISTTNKVELRAVVDYRLLQGDTLLELSTLLTKTNISTIITNTGCIIDDLSDNLLTCNQIKQQTGLKTGFNVYHASKEDFRLIKKHKIDVLRFSSIKLVESLLVK